MSSRQSNNLPIQPLFSYQRKLDHKNTATCFSDQLELITKTNKTYSTKDLSVSQGILLGLCFFLHNWSLQEMCTDPTVRRPPKVGSS